MSVNKIPDKVLRELVLELKVSENADIGHFLQYICCFEVLYKHCSTKITSQSYRGGPKFWFEGFYIKIS